MWIERFPVQILCKVYPWGRITNAGWDLIEGISWAAVHDLKSLSISVFMGNNW